MVTQSSKPSGQVRSPTTPMGEESVTPVSQPSGLGELSASMFTEPDMKQEVIQRAQVSSLMGANGNKEPQDKTPKKQSPAIAASKAIANIPTWMGYFARWRVWCMSISKASEILVGCKRIEKENLR